MVRNFLPLVIPAGTGNGIGHRRRLRRQRGDLPGQQVGELLQPQPGGQREIADRGVAGQLPAVEAGVRPPSGASPRSPCGTAR